MGRKTKMALTVGAASVAAWAASKVVAKPAPREGKKALDFDNPIILAHRGGLAEAPANTMTAFSAAADLGVHGFAVDIRLTKDEEIIVFHDEFVDHVTDFTGKVADYTMSELQKADAGYTYTNDNGEHPYRDIGERILSLRELLETFSHMLIAINLTDTPDTYEGSLMPSKLWRLLEELGAEDRVIVMSAYDEQTDRFNLYAQNRVAIGAGNNEVKRAYAAFTSKFGHLYSPRVDVFIVPEKLGVFPLGTESFIHFLSSLNMPIYFEGITNPETFTRLLNTGAAGFVTNHSTLAMDVVQKNSGE